MPAIAIYLPRLATFIKFNPKAIKRWISKVGGDIKITEVMCATITADKIGNQLPPSLHRLVCERNELNTSVGCHSKY